MVVVGSNVSLRRGVEDVFKFLTSPENLPLLYPREMRVKLISYPEELREGGEIRIAYTMLGQRFRTRFRITKLERNKLITLEALESPFKTWRHEHRISNTGKGNETLLEDRVEIKTIQGPLGDYVAAKIIKRVLDYRNAVLKRILEGSEYEAVYRDPFRISLAVGTVLTALGTAAGFIPLMLIPTGGLTTDIIAGLISFLLLWFFPHDLAHLTVGYLTGVRFSYYYIGLSNLTRLLPTKLKTLPIVLGIRIDRGRSRAGKLGFAAMYLAGPSASMLLPFLPPVVLFMKQNGLGIASSVLLVLAAANLLFSLFFSYRVGCIGKALRALGRRKMV